MYNKLDWDLNAKQKWNQETKHISLLRNSPLITHVSSDLKKLAQTELKNVYCLLLALVNQIK